MPRPNVGLMRQVLQIIEEDPGDWNQDSWCDCFAGITLDISGYDVQLSRRVYERSTGRLIAGENGVGLHAATIAARLLGIDPPENVNAVEGDHLFNESWSFDGLNAKVDEYARKLNGYG